MSSSADERWILCGGANHASAPEDALRLAVHGSDANLSVDIAGLASSLIANIPPAMKDLIRVASYVIAGDQAFPRGDANRIDLGDKWRRDMRFVVAVEEPDIWNAPDMLEALQSTLGFLSDDDYTFHFVPVADREPEQLTFSGPDGQSFGRWEDIDVVQLFSGGMDSFGGAVQALALNNETPVLVSHRSAPKTWKKQKDLVEDLRKWSSRPTLPHVGIEVHKRAKGLKKDRTQRSRSFLYAAMAGTIAHLIGHDRIRFYENGVTSFNIPISRQLVGARATRTTHPKVLRGFARILGLARGKSMEVENPFELKTRAEVLDVITRGGAKDMLNFTISCAHVHHSSNMHPHCGVCSQCIDRRFSVLARGLTENDPVEGYEVDLVNGPWEKEADRALLLDYVSAADRFASYPTVDDFISEHGGEAFRAVSAMADASGRDVDSITRSIYELHQRHGKDVGRVISETMANLAQCIRTPGKLPQTSLPYLLFDQGRRQEATDPAFDADPSLKVESEYVFRQFGQNWTVRFRGGTAFSIGPSKGMTYLHTLLQRPGEDLTAFALIDVAEGREVASRPLATSLGVDDDAIRSVKQTYDELKAERDEAAEFYDDATVARCEAEMEKIEAWLKSEVGLGGKARRENPEQKKARMAVTNAISRAIKTITKANKRCGEYLKDQIRTGFFLRYRDTGIPWET